MTHLSKRRSSVTCATPGAFPYVYTHLSPFRIPGCTGPKDFQANAKSTIRCRPTHMVLGPGGSSHSRFKYPPRLATITVKSPSDGGVSGRASFPRLHEDMFGNHVHGFPFIILKKRCIRQIRAFPSKHGNKQYPPCHYHIKSNTRFDTFRRLKLTVFYLAAAL